MLLPAVLGLAPANGKADWMASGFAILLITAISPVALFQGIRFAHGSAGNVARDWGGIAQRILPTAMLTRRGQRLLEPVVGSATGRVSKALGGTRLGSSLARNLGRTAKSISSLRKRS